MFEPEKLLATSQDLARYESHISDSLNKQAVALAGITAFTCIRICFGQLHIVERKFENYAGQIKNGDFNLIIEDMDWQVFEYDQVLVHSKMEAKEIEVLINFLVSRIVQKVSIENNKIEILFDGDTKLVAKNFEPHIEEANEEVGVRWYFSKGEEWLMTYNTKNMLEFSSLTS